MMKFLHRKNRDIKPQKEEKEPDGIVVTDTMRLYIIRRTQDDRVLGTVLLSDYQFNMLKGVLDDFGIIFTRD